MSTKKAAICARKHESLFFLKTIIAQWNAATIRKYVIICTQSGWRRAKASGEAITMHIKVRYSVFSRRDASWTLIGHCLDPSARMRKLAGKNHF